VSVQDLAPPVSTPQRRNVGFNLTVLGGGQVVTWATSLLWTLVVPRILGPYGMGLMVTAWAATGIMTVVFGLGIRNLIVKEIASDRSQAPSLIGAALLLRLGLIVPGLVAMAFYMRLGHFDSRETAVLYLFTGGTIAAVLAEPLQAGFQALERMEFLALGDVLNKVVQTLGSIAILMLGFGVVALSAWFLVVMVALLLLNLVWIRPHFTVDLRAGLKRVRSLLMESMPYWAFGLFYMVYLWIDSLMLSVMTPPEVVGWYGVPTKVFSTVLFIPVILSTAWLPRLVAAFNQSPQNLRATARPLVELVVVLSLPVGVGTALVARPLVLTLYGSTFAEAVPVLVILGICAIPMYLSIILSQVAVAMNRQAMWSWLMGGATVLNPALNLFLIPYCQARLHNGAIGAALSLILTEIPLVVIGLVVVGGLLDVKSLNRLARAGLATLGMAFAAYESSRWGLVVEVLIGAIAFCGMAIVLRLLSVAESVQLRTLGRRLWQETRVSHLLPRSRR